MSAETAFQRLREANPVPRPELVKGQSRDLTVLLIAARQRINEIPAEDVVEARPRSIAPRKNWILVLAGVFAILIVGVVALLNARPEPDVVDTPDPVLGIFEAVGEMPMEARHSVTLSDGVVLVLGAQADGIGTSVLAFEPRDGTFTSIGSMPFYVLHSITPLADGTVLVMGSGESGYGGERFDPATGSSTSLGSPMFLSGGSAAVRLENGRVLLAGGEPEGATSSAQIFDPITGTFAITGSMARPRGLGATATLLANGLVLVAGGAGDPDGRWAMAEIYDPTTGTFTETGQMSEDRSGHTATLLKDGRVLLTGGYSSESGLPIAAGDLYDPDTGTLSPTGPMQIPRIQHVAALLPDGRVLIAGGNIASGSGDGSYLTDGLVEAEIFDPETGQFTMTAPMKWPRGNAGSAVLPNGDVLIVGHANFAGGGAHELSGAENTAEVFR